MTENDPYDRPGETVDVIDDRIDETAAEQESDDPPYRDEEWLYQQYHTLTKSIRDIAEECDVYPKTIHRWLTHHGIETRPARRGGEVWSDTPWRDGAWLREQYEERAKSIQQIADESDCAEKTIRNWLQTHNIETRSYSERHPTSRDDRPRPYRDEDWLREQYADNGKSSNVIARECDVSPSTIHRWLDAHNIETRTAAESLRRTKARPTQPRERETDESDESDESDETDEQVTRTIGGRTYTGEATGLDTAYSYLSERGEQGESPYRDEEWLREQYEQRDSIAEIAEICNVDETAIRYWMDKCGIEREQFDSDSPHREEDWLRTKYEEHGTATAIVEHCAVDVTPSAILYWMDEHGIERDPAAGARVKHENEADMTYELFLDAISSLSEDRGDWPTVREYEAHRPDWAPAKSTVYGMDAFESWSDAVADAKTRAG